MAAEPPAAEVRCPNCGAVLAVTSGPDGLAVGPPSQPIVTIRCRRTQRLQCNCGYEFPWSRQSRQKGAETC